MSTKLEFDNDAIASFCNNNGVTITLTQEQLDSLGTNGTTPLLVDQLTNVADQLFPDDESLMKFLEMKTTEFHPVSLSLFVLNDDLWNIMSRKPDNPDKMLPMSTIPWFYWEKEAESRGNPAGVRRQDDSGNPLTLSFEKETLRIQGRGGDFCGLLEGRIVDRYKGIRPLFIPGDTGPKKTIPNYESQKIQITINMKAMKKQLYPTPIKELDYHFSEHPRSFYDNGIQIEVEGEDINLKVGKRRETTLRGRVIIFIGKDFGKIPNLDDILMFHVWLNVLNRVPFL